MIHISFSSSKSAPTPPIIKDSGFRVPDDGNTYGQVLHDLDVFGDIRQNRPGYPNYAVPATRVCRPLDAQGRVYEYRDMPEKWAWWLYGFFDYVTGFSLPRGKIEYYFIINAKGEEVPIPWEDRENYEKYKTNEEDKGTIFAKFTEGSLLWVYGHFVQKSRAFTDGNPIEVGRYDPVTGRNKGARTYEWKCSLTTTGNVFRILGDWNQYHRVKTLKFNDPLPSYADVLAEPGLVHWATEQAINKLPDGRYVVSRFPQVRKALEYNGLPQTGNPFPLLTDTGESFIEKRYIKILQPGQAFSMYVPEKW